MTLVAGVFAGASVLPSLDMSKHLDLIKRYNVYNLPAYHHLDDMTETSSAQAVGTVAEMPLKISVVSTTAVHLCAPTKLLFTLVV